MPETAVAVDAAAPERQLVRVLPVRSTVVVNVWLSVEPMIRAAVAEGPGDETVADILELLSRREYQLWVVLVDGVLKAAVITQLVVRPRTKLCRIVYLGGADSDVWVDALEETVSGWARHNGCEAIECYGRKGWAKLSKKIGAQPILTLYRKRL